MVDIMRQQIAEENQATDEPDLTHPDPAHEIGCLKVSQAQPSSRDFARPYHVRIILESSPLSCNVYDLSTRTIIGVLIAAATPRT
jgi:hypothetical protein